MKTPEEKAQAWCRANDAANCIDVWLAGYEQAAEDLLAFVGSTEFRECYPERFDRAVVGEAFEWAASRMKEGIL